MRGNSERSGRRTLRRAAFIAWVMLADAGVCAAQSTVPLPETVVFSSGPASLHGQIYRPVGAGLHPAVLFLHGGGDSYQKEAAAVGRLYATNGYLLFVPSRRGQGLSEQMGDVLAALRYLQGRRDVDRRRIAVAGHSFGAVLSLVAAARASGVRAAIASAPVPLREASTPNLRADLREAVRKVPIFVFRAENDDERSPSDELGEIIRQYSRWHAMWKIFPSFGATSAEGHSFGYFGGAIYAPDVFAFLAEHMDEAWTSIRASAPREWEGDIDGKAAWTMSHYGSFLDMYPDHVLAADAMFEMAVATWGSAGYPELFHYVFAPTPKEHTAKRERLQQWFDTSGFGGGSGPGVPQPKPDRAQVMKAREMFREIVAKYPSARPVAMSKYYSAVILDYCLDDRRNAIVEYEAFVKEHHLLEPYAAKAKRRIEMLRAPAGDRVP